MVKSKFFNIGKLVATKSVNYYMAAEYRFAVEVTVALHRYAVKDWGFWDESDKQVNNEALKHSDNLYLLGAYQTSKGKIYIITNNISQIPGDTATTICFSDER